MTFIDTETVPHSEPIPYTYNKFTHRFPVFGKLVSHPDDISDAWMDHPERILNGQKSVRWDQSVYYWWFEYLKRHEGYRAYCETRQGPYEKLYADFGNIHFTEHYFMKWFSFGGCELFVERDLPGRFEETYDPTEFVQGRAASRIAGRSAEYIYLAVPIENTRKRLLDQFDHQITKIKQQRAELYGEGESTAKYPVYTANVNPVRLQQALRVWDLRKQGLKNSPIHEEVFGTVSDKEIIKSKKDFVPSRQMINDIRSRKYQKRVKRAFDDAEAMIRNVALGKFPCTD